MQTLRVNTHLHTHTHRCITTRSFWELMANIPSRLLRGNWVNERVSATEWPFDHPFYCLTNSPCLCHLTAQKDPQDRGEGEGGKLNSSRVMEAAGKRSRKPWKTTKRERLKCCAISFQNKLDWSCINGCFSSSPPSV